MERTLAERLTAALQGRRIEVEGERWDIFVFAAHHAGDECFLRIALIGEHTYTLTILINRRADLDAASRQIVDNIREWLLITDRDDDGFIDVTDSIG